MPDIKAKISQSGLLKGSSTSQNEVVASKVEVNTAGINLGDLTDVTITSPSDGSFVIFQNSSNTFIDDQTIVKTGTGITLTGELVATSLDISGNVDVDGTLEADAITVNGITLAETISDTVGTMIADGTNTESGISVTYEDSDNTLDFNVDDFSITLTGDVAGSGTVTNLGDVSFATTIQPNSVALGTDTTGDYVSNIVTGGGKGIALSSIGTIKTVECKWTNLPNFSSSLSRAPADNQYVILGQGTNGDSPFKSTLAAFQDETYSNVSGDIVIAAGGAATIQATSVENSMLAGSISNDKLAGSITNAKLANSTVSFGGISVALGSSDATPAFNLSDATNYPTSSLSGTITNAQLAGSITNDKLQNSTITVSDGSNTSLVALGGTLTFAGTSNEVTVAESSGTVTIGLPDDVTLAGELEATSLDINGDADISGTATADEFVGDLRGAVRFQAKAGESLAKGDVVYISDVSGQKPVVSKARADSATTMPAFGLANATVNNNANLEVISFGTFAHGDTRGGAENWEFGDVLYVSSTTAGALTNLKPSGESNLIQNVGKVERVHASSGSIMVAGAGRTAATPNLDEGKFFIGDSNNYSSIGSFNNQFINTSGTISLSNDIAISGELEGGSLDINGDGDISGNLVLGGNLTVSGTETVLNSTTLTVDDKNIVIGRVDTPSDTTADGGGITLKGLTDKTINWVDATDSWTSSENFELASERTFRINANEVLSQTTLGSTVLASSLTSVGTIGTGTWQGTAIANDYIGSIDASKIESGTLSSNRLSGSYTGITGIGTISSLNIMPPSGTTGHFLHISRGGNASFVLSGVGAVGDEDYVAPGEYVVSGAASAMIIAPSISLVGALGVTGDSTLNGALTVNNNSFEIVSTDDDADSDPTISLYRNRASAADGDDIGKIKFYGNNDAGTPEKIEYAGIYAEIDDMTDGTEDGELNFYAMAGGVMEDPVMRLDKGGLELLANNDLVFGINSLISFQGDTADSTNKTTLYVVDPTDARSILLPNASGTLALTTDIPGTTLTQAAQTNITSLGTLTGLTTGATTVNGALTVNNNFAEIVSTDDGATAKPILSLYRNSSAPVNNDRMGGIRFFGNNNADPAEKTFYAGIDAVSNNVTADGNVGSLRFYLANGSSTSSPITDVSDNITDDEDPVMALYKHGLEMGANNDIFLATKDDVLEWKDTGTYDQKLQGRQAETSGGNSVITMPDKATGVLAVTEAETFTGGMTVEGGLTSSPPIQTITGATTSVNNTTFLGYAGKRIMVTTTNALTIDLPDSDAGDEGKTWVIMNASNNEITLDADNNGTAQYFRILTGGSVITPNQSFGGIKNIKITKGGIAELVCLGNGNSFSSPSYLIFGSGVHYE